MVGAAEAMCAAARRSCMFLLSVTLCFHLLLHHSQAFKVHLGYDEEDQKVPLAVIVPDPTPELSSPAPLAAPPPLSGGGDDDTRPRLPTERWRRGYNNNNNNNNGHREKARRAAAAAHAPAPAPITAAASSSSSPAEAPAPEPGSGAALIKSSPAVPVPRGVTDTATILPMPAPGEEQQQQQEVGAATWVGSGGMVLLPLLMLGFTMMASFGLY